MKVLTLKRVDENDNGTFGVLIGTGILLPTLERQWQNNESEVSCIPPGEYTCRDTISPHFGRTYEVIVDHRTHILFHKGNIQENSKGCILLGCGYGIISGQWGITDSGAAFSAFIKYLLGEPEFKLVIKGV